MVVQAPDEVRRRFQEKMYCGHFSADQQRTIEAILVDAGLMVAPPLLTHQPPPRTRRAAVV